MDKTPKVNRGAKASPVRVIKADGSVETQPAYDLMNLRRVQGHGPKPPEAPKPRKPQRNKRRRYVSVPNAAKKRPGDGK